MMFEKDIVRNIKSYWWPPDAIWTGVSSATWSLPVSNSSILLLPRLLWYLKHQKRCSGYNILAWSVLQQSKQRCRHKFANKGFNVECFNPEGTINRIEKGKAYTYVFLKVTKELSSLICNSTQETKLYPCPKTTNNKSQMGRKNKYQPWTASCHWAACWHQECSFSPHPWVYGQILWSSCKRYQRILF